MRIVLSIDNKEFKLKSSQYKSIDDAAHNVSSIIASAISGGFLTDDGYVIIGSDLFNKCIITIKK